MAQLRCSCGNVLSDTTDFLPYKARILADEDTQKPLELIAQELAGFIDAHKQGPEAERAFLIRAEARNEDISEEDAATVFDLRAKGPFDTLPARLFTMLWPFWDRYPRVIYECDVCGRLLVQERKGPRFFSYARALRN
jgi:hypothetical protein